MEKEKRVIVAHPGKQHSYRLANALKNINLLDKYITTVYYNEKRFLYKILNLILKNSDNQLRMKSRCSEELTDKVKQICEIRGLFLLLLQRIDKSKILYGKWDVVNKKFSEKVAKYCLLKKVDALVLYDTNGLPGFSILKQSNEKIIKIMDVSIAARNYTKMIYSKEANKDGRISLEFKKYLKEYENNRAFNKFIDEINYVDHFLVPSNFVKQSLIYNNVDEKKIHVVPYGVDVQSIDIKKYKEKSKDDKIKFIFSGTLSQRKGIGYLLEAIKQLNDERIELILAGSQNGDDQLYKEYSDYYTYVGFVTHDKMMKLFQSSDVYIFPTMSEGFSLTILEAMACGLPVITTPNSGSEGVVINGKNGFLIEAGSVEEIKSKIKWILKNKDEIAILGKEARKTAENFTWDIYEKNIKMVMNNILNIN